MMSNKILEGSTWAEPPSLTLTITGNSVDLQGFLDAPTYRSVLHRVKDEVHQHLNHGHNFKDPEEVLEWVQDALMELE